MMGSIKKYIDDIPVNFDKKIIARFDSRAPIFSVEI
jgi:hypothetical protein